MWVNYFPRCILRLLSQINTAPWNRNTISTTSRGSIIEFCYFIHLCWALSNLRTNQIPLSSVVSYRRSMRQVGWCILYLIPLLPTSHSCCVSTSKSGLQRKGGLSYFIKTGVLPKTHHDQLHNNQLLQWSQCKIHPHTSTVQHQWTFIHNLHITPN